MGQVRRERPGCHGMLISRPEETFGSATHPHPTREVLVTIRFLPVAALNAVHIRAGIDA